MRRTRRGATDLCAGEIEVIAEQLDEGPAILDFDIVRGAVDGQTDFGAGD